jgi:hypothetical protein
MPKLFVTNLTTQDHKFMFRLVKGTREKPAEGSPKSVDIRAGQQAYIGDFKADEVAYVIEQWGKYGIVDAKSIGNTRGFHGFLYSLDKAAGLDPILVGDEANGEALDRQAQHEREVTAQAIHERAQGVARDTDTPLHRTSLETIAETGGDSSGHQVAEGYETPSPGVAPKNAS